MKLFRASRTLSLLAVASLLVFAAATVDAAQKSAAKDEKKLNIGITMLNNNSKLPQADKVIAKKFEEEFDLKADKLSSLKSRGLGYGELTAVLAIADKMDGGLSDTNINKVMGMQKGKTTNWGQIASNLKVDLADVADRVNSFEDAFHGDIKEAAVEGVAGRGAGGGEVEDDSGLRSDSPDESGGAAGGTEEGKTGGSY